MSRTEAGRRLFTLIGSCVLVGGALTACSSSSPDACVLEPGTALYETAGGEIQEVIGQEDDGFWKTCTYSVVTEQNHEAQLSIRVFAAEEDGAREFDDVLDGMNSGTSEHAGHTINFGGDLAQAEIEGSWYQVEFFNLRAWGNQIHAAKATQVMTLIIDELTS